MLVHDRNRIYNFSICLHSFVLQNVNKRVEQLFSLGKKDTAVKIVGPCRAERIKKGCCQMELLPAA